jgi:hypothetical protein
MSPSNGNSFLQSYLDANLTLAKTMVIKSNATANAINDILIARGGVSAVDLYDPTSWKYYKNIAGEYHSTDVLMTVTSLDTLQPIDFTKENLETHTATAKAYAYGTRYYYSLVNRYPEQETLILGILTPCDVNKAIEAVDGTILTYPQYLVEPQEQTLIQELEDHLITYHTRWNVKSFSVTDSLYDTSFLAVMYLNISPKLLNLRLKRCKTDEAHSFHVREYLASHGALDRYLPYLTQSQIMFLYRNVKYIMRNAGRVENFKRLIDKLLTERQIPIAEYSIRQLNTFDSKLYPKITARKKPINDEYNTTEISYVDTSILYDKEVKISKGNRAYIQEKKQSMDRKFQNCNSSVIQTKALESSMVDYSDAVPEPLTAVLLRQWCYLASEDLYPIVVNFKDVRSGEPRSLYAKDALIYMLYIKHRSHGVGLETIPHCWIPRYRKKTLPSLDQLLSVTDGNPDLTPFAISLLSNQPEITEVSSVSSFFDLSRSIYEEAKRHWFMLSNVHDLYDRVYVENMVHSLYEDKIVDLNSENYRDIFHWLQVKNLPEFDYSIQESMEMISSIFTAATGLFVDDNRVLKSIQKQLVNLLMELSSYTIQTIVEINADQIKPLNWASVRTSKPEYNNAHTHYPNQGIRLNDAIYRTSMVRDMTQKQTTIVDSIYGSSVLYSEIDTATEVIQSSALIEQQLVNLGNFYVNNTFNGTVLTEEQLLQLQPTH